MDNYTTDREENPRSNCNIVLFEIKKKVNK